MTRKRVEEQYKHNNKMQRKEITSFCIFSGNSNQRSHIINAR